MIVVLGFAGNNLKNQYQCYYPLFSKLADQKPVALLNKDLMTVAIQNLISSDRLNNFEKSVNLQFIMTKIIHST